ncbi:MAG: acyltransferase [Gammaproteobacteria bacterium]|nr:acyltransferase [Gammaproteobacteria bacterium]MDH5729031.1 acyltransferase [Gammaproteobacteria bacterium]
MSLLYRSDIDGLRAIAVLSVLFFHAGSELFSGGYVGVDVFFVISGYLITSIILREINSGTFSILQFYERRFRRILPALVVVIIASIVVGAFLLTPDGFSDFGQSALAASVFSSNILFFLESGYFDAPAELKPLLHTWSLAVEEQYYIFFPILLLAIAKFSSKRFFQWLVILCIASFITGVVMTRIDASSAFYLIPARAWELFVGSILALNVIPKPNNRILRESLALIGTGFIIAAVFFFTNETLFPGYAAALPVLGAALIIYAGIGGRSLIFSLLSLRPVVFIGLISYSLYLWHWPILVYTKLYFIKEPSTLVIASMLGLTLLLSVLSWKFVETPFRKKIFLKQRNPLLAASIIVSLAIFFTGALINFNNGFPARHQNYLAKNMMENDIEWNHWDQCQNVSKKLANKQDLCDIGNKNAETSFLFWGDSHARALASGIDLAAQNQNRQGKIATEPGCPPLFSIERGKRTSCDEFNQSVYKYLQRSPEITTVILTARWALSTNGTRYKHEGGRSVKLIDLEEKLIQTKNNLDLVDLGLRRTIEKITQLGKRVVLIGPTPEIGYYAPSAYVLAKLTGRDLNQLIAPTLEEFNARAQSMNTIIEHIEKDYEIAVVQPADLLCNHERCIAAKGEFLMYRDNNHLSTYGAKSLEILLSNIFD